ncbi:hypothetical protein FPV67DRAFT_585000 [Lyophyllum atratum]|nr:hypothetical protein FPV67DRAFT_585000 [Lyophyllum atratum]
MANFNLNFLAAAVLSLVHFFQVQNVSDALTVRFYEPAFESIDVTARLTFKGQKGYDCCFPAIPVADNSGTCQPIVSSGAQCVLPER